MTNPEKSIEVHYKILNAVTKLEVSKGHLNWRISEVAKEANVTRSLIYYYLGKDKEIILKEAVKFMLEKIFNLFEDEPVQVRQRIKVALKELKQMPYLIVLFYFNRNQDNEIGKIIKDAEIRLFELFKKIYPTLQEFDILKLYLLELGSVIYGDLSVDQIDAIFPE